MGTNRAPIPLLLIALSLAACPLRAPPPLLTIGERNCAMAPDLATAVVVPLKSDSPAKVVIDENTACLQPANEPPRLYAVFVMPQSTEPFFLSVTSMAYGRGLLAPHISLLNADGNIIREISHDRFLVRGNSLNTSFRPQGDETFLVVTSDPAVVGEKSSGIVASTQTSTVATGTGGFFMMSTGRESVQTLTRAHNGIITVSAELLPQPRQ